MATELDSDALTETCDRCEICRESSICLRFVLLVLKGIKFTTGNIFIFTAGAAIAAILGPPIVSFYRFLFGGDSVPLLK